MKQEKNYDARSQYDTPFVPNYRLFYLSRLIFFVVQTRYILCLDSSKIMSLENQSDII
jgi:hypothetical protein